MNQFIKRTIRASVLSVVLTCGVVPIAFADKCPHNAHKVDVIECAEGCSKDYRTVCCKRDDQPAWCHTYEKGGALKTPKF